ncbi:MFS transporter [Streptosporangium sp. DT93]|uniref:MFS transporter n=1 Tax=Streptosporangium sp. DT93 TaxID=3393428 RepID=UPI003CF08C30
MVGRSPGRRFRWFWAAYAVSAFGTWLAFDAFALIAILALDAGPAEVSLLAAAGPAVGALVAVPLGPWVEFRRKRPVMIAMDLVRFAALMSVPAAHLLGRLSLAQLLVVAVVVGAADIAFTAASGAYLKALVRPGDLLVANGRLEATTWTATALGPPLGTAAIGLLGPVVSVAANAVSFLLSAAGIRAIGGREPHPTRTATPSGAEAGTGAEAEVEATTRAAAGAGGGVGARAGDMLEGWRYILATPELRPLFLNTVLVNGLIMASSPLLAVLMLGDLGFAPWQYGLAFGVPCAGGLIGSRLARPLVARFGRHRVMLTAGTLRACWPLGLAFVGPGPAGLLLVIVLELGLITCAGVFNPVFATYRLERLPSDRIARTLAAWSITGRTSVAAMTGAWGLLAGLTGPRVAIAVAGLLLLATPLLLPRHDRTPRPRNTGRTSSEGRTPA